MMFFCPFSILRRQTKGKFTTKRFLPSNEPDKITNHTGKLRNSVNYTACSMKTLV